MLQTLKLNNENRKKQRNQTFVGLTPGQNDKSTNKNVLNFNLLQVLPPN
jgi:hypothetical protein